MFQKATSTLATRHKRVPLRSGARREGPGASLSTAAHQDAAWGTPVPCSAASLLTQIPASSGGASVATTHDFASEAVRLFRDADVGRLARLEATYKNREPVKPKRIAFVSPLLPHLCELEIWNDTVRRLGVEGVVLTSHQEEYAFNLWASECKMQGGKVALECRSLETTHENRTFLAGLETELAGIDLVVAVGENSLASYQAMKARRQLRHRLAIWQTAPRPPHSQSGHKLGLGANGQQVAREKTIRREVLGGCDLLIAFDKDSATWAYLEDVSAQRIRRVNRGLNARHFNIELAHVRRAELRLALGLPEGDLIFLQAGPLELEAGALDTVYAFKNLLQSNPGLVSNTKLAFCGTGNASAEVRQAVVELRLDDQVFFFNPNDPGTRALLGNQMSNLLGVCDAIIHNPIGPVNGQPNRNLDCTYDLLCAAASGLTIVSNGHGWVGEWIARFFRTFASGSIHSQAKLMRDAIDKRERLGALKNSARKAIENEFAIESSVTELAKIFDSLLQATIEIDNSDLGRLFEQIERAVQAKKYVDAIDLISAAFSSPGLSNSQQATLFRTIGECFTKLGDLSNGLQNFARAFELDPFCAKTLIGLGTVALQAHNYNIAVPQFQKAVELAPNDDLASLGLGLAFEGLGELQEALNWTVRACNLNIENTAGLYNLVKLSYDLEQFGQAEVILQRYVGLHPNDVNMVFTLGGMAYKTGRVELARSLMENILLLDPMNSRAHGLLAQIHRRHENKKRA